MNHRSSKPSLAGLFAAAAAIVLACAASRAAVTVSDVSGPYGNYSAEDAWAQRVVTLRNTDAQERSMKFGLLAEEPGRGKVQYTRIVSVPAGAERRAVVAFKAGRLTPLGNAPAGADRPVPCEQIYVLQDVDTGKMIPQRAQQTTKIAEATTTVSFISDKMQRGDSASYMRDLPGRQLGTVQLMSAQARDLPDVWYGYSMVDLLVMGAVDVSKFRASQTQAMLDWVQRGGLLVVAGGESMERMLRGEFGEAAGVAVVGMHDAAELKVDGPLTRGVGVELAEALPMAEIQTVQAEVVYKANGLPLLTSRAFGHGHVLTLALPLRALADPKLHPIWTEVRNIGRSLPPLDAGQFRTAGMETLKQVAGRRGPTRMAPVAILVGLSLLVLAVGLSARFMRRQRRGEMVWLILIPLAIVISAALYVYGLSLSNPERLRHIALLCGLDDGRARAQEAFAYYSGPEAHQVDLASASPRGLISSVGAQTAGTTLEVSTANGTVLPGVNVRSNDTAAFYVDSVDAVTALKARLSLDENGLAGSIANLLPDRIENAVIYAGGLSYAIDTLGAGETSQVRISQGAQLAEGEFTGGGEAKVRRNELVRALVSRPAPEKAGGPPGPARRISRGPLLIGYAPYSPLDPVSGRKLERNGWCVVAWPIEVVPPVSGAKVAIPAGFVRVEEEGSLRDAKSGGYLESQNGGALGLKVRPPDPLDSLLDAAAHLTINLSATNFQLTISGGRLDANGAIAPDVAIKTVDSPAGPCDVEIPQADRFAAPDGSLLFHLRIKRLETDQAAKATTAKVHSIRVALKGTVR